jgi:hypothetical protein
VRSDDRARRHGRRAASPAAAQALGRCAESREGRRLARFVEQRRDELLAAVAGAGAVDGRERTAIWSHAVAGEAIGQTRGATRGRSGASKCARGARCSSIRGPP